ncbi:MAG TPA: cbb3-type cytochrome c oxidase subunit 3 [Nitrospirota bacterium]|nr:cbb3-type cytochrome c oxidase subunit 3 [Nitrospirota bacterium]
MALKAVIYFGFTIVLAVVFIGVVIYFYRAERKAKVEAPKYRMLDED